MSSEVDDKLEKGLDVIKKKNSDKEINVTVDSTQIRKDLNEEITSRVNLEKENESLRKQVAEYEKLGGTGSLSMTPSMIAAEKGAHQGSKSFENYSQMVSHLKEQIRKGDATAKTQYKQLVQKSVDALKSKSVVWQDNNPNEPSMIQNILQERNRRFRESKKVE